MKIRSATLTEVLMINQQIPEFSAPYGEREFQKRCANKDVICLLAEEAGEPMGFKLGYGLTPKVLYSWLGGVLPWARRKGVAQALLDSQEGEAKNRGYDEIKVKTRNRHRNMLQFLVKNDYQLLEVEQRDEPADYRIHFNKLL